MKKFLALLTVVALLLAFAACNKTEPKPEDVTPAPDVSTPAPDENTPPADDEGDAAVMSYAEYAAADLDSPVTVETYVQAKQSWWDNKATLYTQDEDGAYFLYNMPCTEEEYAQLVPGTKIRVSGFKSEWAGEVEIIDSEFEILDGSFIAQPVDVTALLGTDGLIDYQNRLVSFKGMTVEDSGEGCAFLYKWDGSGADGDDLYFNVSVNGQTYTFTVESYLCDKDSDVYAAVKALNVGDVIDMEGFLYWYEGVNPHITSVTPTADADFMSYAEYAAADFDTPVVVETYVQAKQSWWDDKATLYTQDEDGAYFIYNAACTEEEYPFLVPGTKIRVTGYKSQWAGEIEIVDGEFEFLDGSFIAEPMDVTALLGTDELIDYQNRFVSFKGMTVEDSGDGAAFLYKWDGSGSDGDDLYFNVSVNGQTYTFTVESYLCDKDSDVYAAVKALNVGDVIDMEGFLYWYEGVNPHITSVTAG